MTTERYIRASRGVLSPYVILHVSDHHYILGKDASGLKVIREQPVIGEIVYGDPAERYIQTPQVTKLTQHNGHIVANCSGFRYHLGDLALGHDHRVLIMRAKIKGFRFEQQPLIDALNAAYTFITQPTKIDGIASEATYSLRDYAKVTQAIRDAIVNAGGTIG
jgi:hypothetical protein